MKIASLAQKKQSDGIYLSYPFLREGRYSYFWKQSSENNEFLPFMLGSILDYFNLYLIQKETWPKFEFIVCKFPFLKAD